MVAGVWRTSTAAGVLARMGRFWVVVVVVVLTCAPQAHGFGSLPPAGASPLPLAQVGAGLVAPPLNEAVKPVAAAAAVATPAAPAAAAATSGGGTTSLIKYAPIYLVMTLLIALGTFIICRPKSWAAAVAPKK